MNPQDICNLPELEVLGDMEWLEDMGRFSRYAVGTEDSVWICRDCISGDVDPYENHCYHCDEDGEDEDWLD